MAIVNCVTKTVSMSAGEVFVLPPGAEIIYVSDPNLVTSSCDEDLPTEPLLCYEITWTVSSGNTGTQAWDINQGSVSIIGASVGGVYYDGAPSVGGEGVNLKTFLEANNVPLVMNITSFNDGTGMTNAYKTGIRFKSIASIAEQMFVAFDTLYVTEAKIYATEVTCS